MRIKNCVTNGKVRFHRKDFKNNKNQQSFTWDRTISELFKSKLARPISPLASPLPSAMAVRKYKVKFENWQRICLVFFLMNSLWENNSN